MSDQRESTEGLIGSLLLAVSFLWIVGSLYMGAALRDGLGPGIATPETHGLAAVLATIASAWPLLLVGFALGVVGLLLVLHARRKLAGRA